MPQQTQQRQSTWSRELARLSYVHCHLQICPCHTPTTHSRRGKSTGGEKNTAGSSLFHLYRTDDNELPLSDITDPGTSSPAPVEYARVYCYFGRAEEETACPSKYIALVFVMRSMIWMLVLDRKQPGSVRMTCTE